MDAQLGLIVALDGEIPAIRVVLSERNLRTLLLTVNEEHNDVTRYIPEIGMLLSIAAEPNDVHYKDREAGLMNEATELKLAAEELGDDDTQLFVPEDLKLQ